MYHIHVAGDKVGQGDKRLHKKRISAAGDIGRHPSDYSSGRCPEQWRQDAICMGEGEDALFEYIQSLRSDRNRYDMKNLCFIKEGSIVLNPLRDRIEDLDSLPYPDWELFYGPPNNDVSYAEFLASRGCPFSCAYCAEERLRNLYQKRKIRFKSPEHLIEEICAFRERYPNLSFIFFQDDNLNLYKDWLTRFCDLYKKRIDIPFGCNLHYNLIDEETVATLKTAGCFRIHVGVETGNENLRKNILNKNISNATIIKSSSLLKNAASGSGRLTCWEYQPRKRKICWRLYG